MGKKLKIMHGLSEVAGQNAYSVLGLKEIGEEAQCVVYCRHPFAYPYDRSLDIDKSNRKLFPLYACRLAAFFLRALCRFDCFHFHFGHSILNEFELPLYRLLGKKVFFEFHGSDLRDEETFCRNIGLPFDPSKATDPRMHARNRKICRSADGIIIHDDELIPYLPKERAPVYVVPLRVDLSRFEPKYPDPAAKTVRIVHAPSKRAIKGTEYVLRAFERLREKYPQAELVLVEGKTQQEAIAIYESADIIVDQLLIGTYGVFAIEGMAMGKPVVTFISDAMKERLPAELPIISADIRTLEQTLEKLILDGELRRTRGVQGRLYAENYHDYRYAARELREIYYGRAEALAGREAFEQIRRIRQETERNV